MLLHFCDDTAQKICRHHCIEGVENDDFPAVEKSTKNARLKLLVWSEHLVIAMMVFIAMFDVHLIKGQDGMSEIFSLSTRQLCLKNFQDIILDARVALEIFDPVMKGCETCWGKKVCKCLLVSKLASPAILTNFS